ncbi:MAG: peptidyl-prolyl cis-trans isomerase [Burkholderiales bacterium]|nr:peptidyl-prolyl cis-trans isomerase [Burkholderiales bacterium]
MSEPPDSVRAGRSRAGRWLREPLLHFLVAGLALFGIYRWINPAAFEAPATNRIVITPDDLRQMSLVWLAQGRPPPTPEQMANLVEAKVREEVLYREALALGLDQDDTIVKRRMAQKMDFLADDLAALAEPTPDELRTWFNANRDRFAQAPRASFRHLYFSPDRRHAQAAEAATQALDRLRTGHAGADGLAGLGDPFMFQGYYPDRSFDLVAKDFGAKFARALFAQTPGAWSGPIESGFGWHLVWIDELTPARIPPFDEVEPEVRRAWISDRRDEMKRVAYQAMRQRYRVVLPDAPAPEMKFPAPAGNVVAPEMKAPAPQMKLPALGGL